MILIEDLLTDSISVISTKGYYFKILYRSHMSILVSGENYNNNFKTFIKKSRSC